MSCVGRCIDKALEIASKAPDVRGEAGTDCSWCPQMETPCQQLDLRLLASRAGKQSVSALIPCYDSDRRLTPRGKRPEHDPGRKADTASHVWYPCPSKATGSS